MSLMDDLRQGSKYHTARELPDGRLHIVVADVDDDECLRGFQALISEAKNRGYHVTNEHKFTQRGLPGWRGPLYDTADILPD
jgi:hypothetical protein